jgi:hypothetical protein
VASLNPFSEEEAVVSCRQLSNPDREPIAAVFGFTDHDTLPDSLWPTAGLDNDQQGHGAYFAWPMLCHLPDP